MISDGSCKRQEDELSFNEGDVLYLVDQSNPDWWKARCGRRLGLIPSNYGKSMDGGAVEPYQLFLSLFKMLNLLI